jgi:signal transduction histidine kinase
LNITFKNRVATYYLVATALITTLLFIAIYWIVHNTVYSHLKEDLDAELSELTSTILVTDDNDIIFANPLEWNEGEHKQIEVNPTFIQVTNEDGNTIKKTSNLLNDSLKFNNTMSSKYYLSTELSKSPIYQLQAPIFNKNGEKIAYLLIAIPLEESEIVLENLKSALFISFPIILMILFFTTRYIAGKAIAPVNNVINTANRITRENLQERIKLPENKDEIYTLTSTINELLNRLKDNLLREIQFTSDASHELRTPLSIIKGTLEVLIRKPREIKQYEEKINYCIKETDRMTRLIDQLLFLAKYDTGKVTTNKNNIDIKNTLTGIINRLKPILLEKEIKINMNSKGSTFAFVDESMMEIVFENVITNSIKYSFTPSEIDIRISDNTSYLECIISDKGIGMTEEQTRKIFDRLYRTDQSRNSEAGGFGLGLSIVKKFCELQDIQLNVESKPSIGTSFIFQIKK